MRSVADPIIMIARNKTFYERYSEVCNMGVWRDGENRGRWTLRENIGIHCGKKMQNPTSCEPCDRE